MTRVFRYWVAKRMWAPGDSPSAGRWSGVRAKTRRGVLTLLADMGCLRREKNGCTWWESTGGMRFWPPKKIEIEYTSLMDLVSIAASGVAED